MSVKAGILFNKSGILNSQGEGRVSVFIRSGQYRYAESTPVYCHEQNWDNQAKRVKKQDPNHEAKNIIIQAAYTKCMNFVAECYLLKRTLTRAEVKAFFKGTDPTTYGSFLKYYKDNIHRSRVTQTLDNSTIQSRQNTLDILKEFKEYIGFKEMTAGLVERFADYRRDMGDSENTVYKHLKNLKSMVTLAMYDGKISDRLQDNPFRTTRIKVQRTNKKEALTFKEYETLKAQDYFPEDGLTYHVWKMFLFACRTTFRVSDVMDFRNKHVKSTENGLIILKKSVKKSGGVYRINLDAIKSIFDDNILHEIINEYWKPDGGEDDLVFPEVREFAIGEKLKMIISNAGIKKNVSFHTGRHTCATHLAAKDVGLHKIMRIGGWNDMRTIQHYINLADEMLGRI